MNTTALRTATLRKTIGATIVTAALTLGAYLGHLTHGNNTAHADTPANKTACAIMCTATSEGSNGPQPGLLTIHTAHSTVGHVNTHNHHNHR